jgi:hypothetical protein
MSIKLDMVACGRGLRDDGRGTFEGGERKFLAVCLQKEARMKKTIALMPAFDSCRGVGGYRMQW